MIIAVDVGTSSLKIGLVDLKGRVLRSYVHEIPLHIENLTAEHDLEFIWKAIKNGIRIVSKGYEGRIEAIALSTYLHGLGVLDKDFSIVVNVMTHLDRRCHSEQGFIEKVGYEIYSRTGCPPIFVFPLCKARWLRKIGMLKTGHRITFVKDYIAYKLSGIHAVDHGVASGTGFLNIHELKWDPKALEIAELDESMLPILYEGSKVFEYVTVKDLGLEKVAVVLSSFDGALQNIGYSIYEDKAVLNLGSTAVVRTLLTECIMDKSSEMRFFTYYAAEGYRVIGGASNNGMMAIDWLRNLLKVEELELHSEAVCREGIYVLPFIAGERYPFRDPNLTLTMIGLRLGHGRAHIFRGLVEGIGFTVKYILKAMDENGVGISSLHCAGGGCSNTLLIQILANIFCKPIALHKDPRNAVILGAIATALKALGYIKSVREASLESSLIETYIYPSAQLCREYDMCFKKFLDLVKMARERLPKVIY